jgi:hypothetical protein
MSKRTQKVRISAALAVALTIKHQNRTIPIFQRNSQKKERNTMMPVPSWFMFIHRKAVE